MPGVPSSKGCEACRRKKKGCDQKKPSCGRCTRAGIPCIGSGQQRFKFQNRALARPAPGTPGGGSGSGPGSGSGTGSKSPSPPVLTLIPVSRDTALAGSLVSRLQVDDLKYDISCYGLFLDHLPQRIGQSEVLDASIDAFVTAYSQPPLSRDSGMLVKYGAALHALADTMKDAPHRLRPEALCAVYLIMLVQAWIGRKDDQSVDHVEGMAIMLRSMSFEQEFDPIQKQILFTMLVPVIYGSMSNPKIKLGPWFFDIVEKLAPRGRLGPPPPDDKKRLGSRFPMSLSIWNLAQLPEFLREPENHHLDILTLYHMTLGDMELFQSRVEAFRGDGPDPDPSTVVFRRRMFRGLQTALSFSVCMCVILNQLLQGFDPEDARYAAEASGFIDTVLPLAEEGLNYWPIGSGHVPIVLTVVWAVAAPRKRAELMTMLARYKGAFDACDATYMALWWKEKFELIHKRLAAVREARPVEEDPPEKDITSGECCVM